MDKEIQKQLDKVVTLPKKDKKEINTYVDVLMYQLDEMIDRGQVGYTQEILLPVPEDMVKNKDKEAKKIIALAGKISREESLEVKTDIGTEEINGREKKFNMINISFKFDNVQQAMALKEYITGLLSRKG